MPTRETKRGDAREACTMLRLTDDEMALVLKAARLNGLTVASFARQQVLLTARAQIAQHSNME